MKNFFCKVVLCLSISCFAFINAKAQQPSATVSVQNVSCGPVKGIAVVTPSGGTGYSYRWSGGSPTGNIDTGLAAGNYTVTVYSTPLTDSVVVPFTIGTAAPITGTVTTYPDHCGKGIGAATVHVAGGDTPYVYVWSMGTAQGDSTSQLSGGDTVHVTVSDSHGCIDSFSANISSIAGPTGSLSIPDTECVSDNVGTLTARGRGFGMLQYDWSSGSRDSVAAGLSPGSYQVTITDQAGCDTILNGYVPAYLAQDVIQINPSATVSPGQDVEIVISTNVPFNHVHWEPYIPGSTNSLIAGFTADSSQLFIVTVSYGNTCQFVDSIQITVVKDTSNPKFIPNTFTPNNDTHNDQFTLVDPPDMSLFHIWIYDRWGNKVFESTDENFAWDGNDQYAGNKPCAVGVYAYVMQYQIAGEEKKTQGGNISLVK